VARSKKVVDDIEGAVPLALNTAPSIVGVSAADKDADLLDVDQEPPKPPPKKRGRKAGMSKSKKNGTATKADDDNAADEDVLHWTLESDRATVQYRPITAPDDVPTAALISELARKRSAARSLKDNAASAPLNSTFSASPPIRPVSLVRFVVRGSPRPLVRHRVSTFRMYNPSAKAQKSFQTAVRTLLANAIVRENPSHKEGDGNIPECEGADIGDGDTVLFPTESLAVSIAFRMRRPLNHFRANRREAGQLRAAAPPQTFVTRSDVDNLAKFVLDSFNGLLYDDDKQVCSLHATKILDNDGLCLGSTEVCVRVVGDDDLPALLDKSFQLF
jgi:Endodeoxyribonuclease RusA